LFDSTKLEIKLNKKTLPTGEREKGHRNDKDSKEKENPSQI
jgi:hypothetical protein